ncbi:hypothetical protein E3P84_01030 [Wallemia ichthyophaga]|nr:hypothetical protein E3P84_01030 [Wallemia ichthyophaga]TIB42791.1 hypothetical protein E3P83_01075 [Wallemia ichthyophaga]
MTTPILKLPNELLIEILRQVPRLAYASKRLYPLGYTFNALSIVGPGGCDRNGFDSRRHALHAYKRFSKYLTSLSLIPSAAESVKWVRKIPMPMTNIHNNARKIAIGMGKCRTRLRPPRYGRTAYHTHIDGCLSRLSTVTDITVTLKKPLSRWCGVLQTLLHIAPAAINIRIYFLAASVEDYILAAHENVEIVNNDDRDSPRLERVIFIVIPAMKKPNTNGEYKGLEYPTEYEDMIESCIVFDKVDSGRLEKRLCATHTIYTLADSYGFERCLCCVQDGLEGMVVV